MKIHIGSDYSVPSPKSFHQALPQGGSKEEWEQGKCGTARGYPPSPGLHLGQEGSWAWCGLSICKTDYVSLQDLAHIFSWAFRNILHPHPSEKIFSGLVPAAQISHFVCSGPRCSELHLMPLASWFCRPLSHVLTLSFQAEENQPTQLLSP